MNDNSLLLNIEIDLEFLIVPSNLYQSFRVDGKGEFLKQSVLCDSEKLAYGLSLF